MYFILKSAVCLLIAFLMLPNAETHRLMSDVSRAVNDDTIVNAAVERTNLATRHVMAGAPRYCVANSSGCVAAAKQIVKDATEGW